MTYVGGKDYKRANHYSPAPTHKVPVDTKPRDTKAPGYSFRRVKHAAKSLLRKLVNFWVFFPSFVGLVFGVALFVYAPVSSAFEEFDDEGHLTETSIKWNETEFFIGRSIFVGSFVTGIFAWTGGVAAAKHKRDDLRVQIGMATDLGNADLVDVEVREVFLRGRELTGARLSRAHMHNADFSGADLTDARLTAGSFVDSDFEDAVMIDIGGYRANFRGCRFMGANLTRAILVEANLSKSDILNANFSHADLRGADLRAAKNISSAGFHRTWYSGKTKWPSGFDPAVQTGLVMMYAEMADREPEMTDREDVDLRDLAARTEVFTDNAEKAGTREVERQSFMTFLLERLVPPPKPKGDVVIDLADPRGEIEAAIETLKNAAQAGDEGKNGGTGPRIVD